MSFAFQFQIEPEDDNNNNSRTASSASFSSSVSSSHNDNTVNGTGFPTANAFNPLVSMNTTASTSSSSFSSVNANDTSSSSLALSHSMVNDVGDIDEDTACTVLTNINISQILHDWTEHSSVPDMLPLSGITKELYQIVVPTDTIQEATRQVDRCSGGVTWEGTYDLLHYCIDSFDDPHPQHHQRQQIPSDILSSLSSSSSPPSHPFFTNRTVMDLGCGSGLLGCYTLLYSPSHLYYHDYNRTVLRTITAANIAINLPILPYTKDTIQDTCTFLAGSWQSLRDRLRLSSSSSSTSTTSPIPSLLDSVDTLLSSETLYRTESYPILCDLLCLLLKPVTGRAYFATKRYYYGLGGGSVPFTKIIQTVYNQRLRIQSIRTIEDGKSMIREILEVQRLS